MTRFNFFSLLTVLLLSLGSLSGQLVNAPTVEQESRSVAKLGAPVLSCAMDFPTGHYLLGESFFENYDYAFRRVAKLRAYGFQDVQLMHTDCRPVDVKGSLYYITLSPAVASKEVLYNLTEECWQRSVEVDCPLINTRIVTAQ